MPQLLDISRELEGLSLLRVVKEIAPDCVLIESDFEAKHLAQFASARGKGQWLIAGGNIFQNLRNAGGWLINWRDYGAIHDAREVCRSITGEAHGWSVASNARAVWTWALPPGDEKPHREKILEGAGIGYHECAPGVYPDFWNVDMSGCYWELLKRLPSRRFMQLSPSRYVRIAETRQEKKRLALVFERLQNEKLMRNSIWGSCLGKYRRGTFFCGGVEEESGTYFGTHPTAAYFVGRMAWELTVMACHEGDAVYAQTDGVIMHKDRAPHVWDFYGMPYKVAGFGTADVRYQHSYRVGKKQTKHYQARCTHREAVERVPLPDRLYCAEWLT